MNRGFDFLRGRSAGLADIPDRDLLNRFLAARDEPAFAELVRRYGPVVWAACRRRLAVHADAEDAFQATFLVLVRRASSAGVVALGPWLHKVAVMTARNVLRGNRRRAAISGPMAHEVPTRGPAADVPDLDAALLGLPDVYRRPVVMCHLQGLSRREAATQLGCPEGTLSARLSRAMARLRKSLGVGGPAALAVTGAVAVPVGLTAATVRTVTIYATATQIPAGVSPVVAGLANGVLRMFRMKKLMTAAVMVGLVMTGGILAIGMGGGTDGAARAADPPAAVRPAPPADPDAAAKRLEQRLAELEKQKAELDKALADAAAEKAALDRARWEKDAAAKLGSTLAVVVNTEKGKTTFIIREVVGGKVGEMTCSDVEVLATYLTRTFNDPKGPKALRIHADEHFSDDRVRRVCAAAAAAGYTAASFIGPETPRAKVAEKAIVEYQRALNVKYRSVIQAQYTIEHQYKPIELELKKFADPVPVKKP